MSEGRVAKFQQSRTAGNELVFKYAGTNMKRFWTLDGQAYQEGALDAKTKELLGLVASLVLRCDDCVTYHTIQCHEAGVTTEEYEETLNIGLLVGGSITIPHLRRAFAAWQELTEAAGAQ